MGNEFRLKLQRKFQNLAREFRTYKPTVEFLGPGFRYLGRLII